MKRLLAALAALATFILGFASLPHAAPCPSESSVLVFHSCWGEARLAVALLPEGLPLPSIPETGRRLVVTGAYTARDARADGLPKPVGLFVHGGRVINPNLGRMDGILIVDPHRGKPSLHHRERVLLDDRSYDLTRLEERRAFIAKASSDGASVLQSHLLIVDGQVDVREQEGAPAFLRRLFFIDSAGFGVYRTTLPLTLQEAADRLAHDLGPRMALNLDMGSYDYCTSAVDGADTVCGILGSDDTAKLSNLLVMTLK